MTLPGIPPSPLLTEAAGQQYDSLWRQATLSDFHAWTASGVSVQATAFGPAVRLAPHAPMPLGCMSRDIDGGPARDSVAGLCLGNDPIPQGSYHHGISYYNGGSFFFGTILSPIHRPNHSFDHLIASWNADTRPGTWLEVRVRVMEGARWTGWYSLGVWAADFSAIHRHSVDHQDDPNGSVDTDTFHTAPHRVATAYQLSVTLFTGSANVSPALRLVSAITSYDAATYSEIGADTTVWGKDLAVPPRSQMLPQYRGQLYGGGGEVWCSPTSTSMIMAYWAAQLHRPALDRTVPETAQGTYDSTYDGTGNWPFNIAYAASFGLTGFVTRMVSMSQIEQWIKAGVPLVMSIAFKNGELPGEPLPSSPGHLIVVRGFTRTGDVITNDPAAPTDGGVRIVFRRSALERVWKASSHGTVYVVYPRGWKIPATKSFGSW